MNTKILAIIIATLFYSILIVGQTVQIFGDDDIEIGNPYTFTANVALPQGWTVTKYKWEYTEVGVNQQGPSGLIGKVEGSTSLSNAYEYSFQTNQLSHDIEIVWSDDGISVYEDLKVTVYGLKADGDPYDISTEKDLNLKRITIPIISPNDDVLSCCQKPVQYCDVSILGTQNSWSWSVSSPAQINGGSTSDCITVIPPITGSYTVNVTAKRSGGNSQYSRTKSITINRLAPPPISLQGNSYICEGDLLNLTFSEYCGEIEDIVLNFPNNEFKIKQLDLNGESPVIILEPQVPFMGQTVRYDGYITLVGGCLVNLLPGSVALLTSQGVICPEEQYLNYTLPANYDPCNPSGGMTITYFDPNFSNGFTTWSPQFVNFAPHHNIGDYIDVTVCTENPCAENPDERECCKVFRIELPAPCPESNAITNENFNLSDASEKQKISLFPNPTDKLVNYQCKSPFSGTIKIIDEKGNIYFENKVSEVLSGTIDITKYNLNRVAYIYFQNNEATVIKTILIK